MRAPARAGSWWWICWVLWCVPAGALAAWGLVEFYLEYPSRGYDGGFAGDLFFFGAFLALGQAPFVAVFVWALLRSTGENPWRRGLAAAGAAVGWFLAGSFGWIVGSFVEVPLSESVYLYSDLRVLTGSVRWIVFGAMQGAVLAVAVALAPVTPQANRAADGRRRGAVRARAALFGLSLFLWVAASAVGGLLYEWWESTDLAARSNGVNRAIGEALTVAGVPENVAYELVPHAIFVPVLYGVPTGLAFLFLRAAALRRFGPGGRRFGGTTIGEA